MHNLCIIPARGGSKRIPGKNIKTFLNKPILSYSIEAALRSELFKEVMVSTENTDIADIAQIHGATIPFMRDRKTADDFAVTTDVVIEVLQKYSEQGQNFDNVCCLYPTAPFVTPEKMRSALHILKENKLDSVFPVVAFGFPIQRALKIVSNKLCFVQPEFALSRSQDLEKSYHDAGQFYWLNVEAFLQKKKIVTDHCGAIIVSELEVQDIDNEVDWKMAELKYQLLRGIS